MNAEDLITLNEEIANMSRAGLPLDRGLAALAREMNRGKLKRVTSALADDLRAGHTLPQALTRRRGQVPPFYAGLVAAGARTGRIGDVLRTLTVYARTISNLRSLIVEAFFYPVTVLVFAFSLLVLLGYFILPQFDELFKDFGLRLPLVTELVLGIGRHPFQLVVLPTLGTALGLTLFRLFLRATPSGRRLWAHLVYAVPVVGTLIRAARLAAFTELLAILVDNELPLPEAFQLAGEACSEPIMAGAARQVSEELSHGKPLGEVLQGRGLVPEFVSWQAGWGERRGTLGATLHQVAEMYRRQVEMRAALLRSVLPPFLVIFTAGLFIGAFVFAIMVPMYKLLEGLAK
jgi:type II secretory pathway component PulF